MRFGHTPRLSHLIAVVGLMVALRVCVSAVAGDPAPVREQIQFSAPGEPVDVPTARPKDESLPGSFEFLGRNSISAVVGPFVSPAPGVRANNPRNSRLLFEAFDRKKNWIYLRSEDDNRTETMDNLFESRGSSESDKRPKGALEEYLEDRGQKSPHNRARETAGQWKGLARDHDYAFDQEIMPQTNAHSQIENPFDSSRTLRAGFALPGNWLATSPGQGRLNDFHNPGWNDSLSSTQDGRNRSDAIRKLLAIPGGINPLVPSFSPINLQVSGELNPAAAQRPGELPEFDGDSLNPLRSVGTAASRSGPLTDPSAHVLGPSSLSPAVAAPTETHYVQPKPTVLEFPRRKF
ncbi:MAG TPA: hypothetical protein VEL06_10395 [Haliangiales bacterium]|nr:hypothetical protein [Haliangiales bacterium]